MEQKEINLKKIVEEQETFDPNYSTISINDAITAMREACKQTLELAAENAECVEGAIVNMGFENIAASVNKQSILDTINQIK